MATLSRKGRKMSIPICSGYLSLHVSSVHRRCRTPEKCQGGFLSSPMTKPMQRRVLTRPAAAARVHLSVSRMATWRAHPQPVIIGRRQREAMPMGTCPARLAPRETIDAKGIRANGDYMGAEALRTGYKAWETKLSGVLANKRVPKNQGA
mgnify:CR=1 FL=1